jgi:uncharacterized protein (UPF0335 family)
MPRGRKKQDTETSVQRTVAPDQLVSLIKWINEKRSVISGLSGEIGERVKHAADNGNLHRAVCGQVAKLARMDEYKRNDWLRQFNLYIDICREKGLFGQEHCGDLLDTTQGDDEAEEEEDIGAQNAAAIEKGIKQLPDEAAEPEKPSRRRSSTAVGDAPATTRFN